jgi:ribose transport system ATP-binding protein
MAGTPLIKRPALRSAVAAAGASVKLKASDLDRQPVNALSGGNQQKVVLAKWLLRSPRVLLLDEPTRGIDIGAKYEIYKIISELALAGCAVLLISSEIEELIGLSDRILVMAQGRITSEFQKGAFDRERMLSAAMLKPGAAR